MVNEAIILAGGLGTRLRAAVADLPKCMAPVEGIPFIHFIVSYLRQQGITKFVFSLGYKNEMVTQYLDKAFEGINKKYIIESEPLGTGGAIKRAATSAESENVLVVNGDTLFNINIMNLSDFHELNHSHCTLALKEMKQFSRYGSVELSAAGIINTFHEKKYCEKGYINGGLYCLNLPSFLEKLLPDKFSFEQDYLEKYTADNIFYGVIHQKYFIDIGIPEDYFRFQQDYKRIALNVDADGPGGEGNNTPGVFLNSFFNLLH